ncbi:hypothetical protein ABZ128_22295 [Streptomyces sp. NPDC006326]|uniref:hypothetical protein n=1 Tax=Streptomyces sp. NPDC006326 TaxID=3156752 RepID=UPI0033B6444B
MAMIGLFWITDESVYVGSPPNADGHCVRLTPEGVAASGPDGDRAWTWSSLRSAVVKGAPVRGRSGGAGRYLAAVVEAVVTMASGFGEGPPEMLLGLETADGTQELPVSAAARGYTAEEIALSQVLLARFLEGTADPRTLTGWSRHHGGTTPKPPGREALLREWTRS